MVCHLDLRFTDLMEEKLKFFGDSIYLKSEEKKHEVNPSHIKNLVVKRKPNTNLMFYSFVASIIINLSVI